MKPAVKLALAYAYATGELPRGIHLATWSAASALAPMIESLEERLRSGRHVELTQAGLEAIAAHPLKLAADWFLARGFKPERGKRRTSHYIAFTRDGMRGLAYRHGGGSVTVEHGERPFVTSLSLEEAERAWPAILRPAMYVGERPSYETGRDYLARAMAAYLESANVAG